jgi:hypothetical protein
MQEPNFGPLSNYQQTALMSVQHDERAAVREVPAVQRDWEFDTSFDYGIANAVSTVRTNQATEQAGSCMH